MKKSVVIQFLVFLTLSAATVAQAQTALDVSEHHAGQGQTSKVDDIVNMGKELDSIFIKISDLNDEVGMTMQDSQGFLKALGEQLSMTEDLKFHFNGLTIDLSQKSGQSLSDVHVKASELLRKARQNLAVSKDLAVESKKYLE